jgi:mono/diheme cytochrome c family protein
MANVGIAVAAIAAITIVSGGQTLAAEVLDPGKAEYHSSCAPCHGSDGKGTGSVSAVLTVPPPDLTILAKMNNGVLPFSAVYEIIDGRKMVMAHGTRDMPIWGDRYAPEPSKALIPRPSENILSLFYDPEAVVRMRILAVIDYLSRIQQK